MIKNPNSHVLFFHSYSIVIDKENSGGGVTTGGNGGNGSSRGVGKYFSLVVRTMVKMSTCCPDSQVPFGFS